MEKILYASDFGSIEYMIYNIRIINASEMDVGLHNSIMYMIL